MNSENNEMIDDEDIEGWFDSEDDINETPQSKVSTTLNSCSE